MNIIDRKAAICAYKERKAPAGIYAIRLVPTGRTWVGRAGDLDKIQNRVWFTLQHGSHVSRSLQTVWNANRPEDFAIERLEEIDEELTGYLRDRTLKDRLIHWAFELGAETA
ncbi:GIY-YIG nuclease family protein [Neorhizobium galegae]|uniref:GIY-YIG nuclease family protein n=1 Tax=Neorhizobium galegae TaxID=399 RepID=UPI002101071E|nr:GIY-YIG nuclease family protein [Neorhizobium galegae]MCQ1569667.1 GIY-YIG nuclease family protein [Neorhizobium galegae]MCQ1833887.1 GIY-YIG nuclease family protein [Neorhizobium galegae]UIY30365.1 GIY-YIG nuclease family protein [Neorhizobium galegae]